MTKEELKQEARRLYIDWERRYCKESISDLLVMFAELREKRIAELEKKNKSLTEQVCNVANNLLDNWCKNEEDYCPHLAKLEKENAELKRDKEDLIFIRNQNAKCMCEDKEKLTNAKELLTRFVMASVYFNGKEKDLVKEAEQFLKE